MPATRKSNNYFTNMGKIVKILWQAQPSFLLVLLFLTLCTGLLTPTLLLISSFIIDVLAKSLQNPQTSTMLPQNLLFLLILLGGINVVGQLCTALRSSVESLYQQRITHSISLIIARKAATLDLSFFENPEFHNLLNNASAEASYRPVTIATQMMTVVSTTITLISVSVIILFWQPWIIPLVLVTALLRFLISTRLSRKRVKMLIEQTPLSRKAQYVGTLLASDLSAKEVRLFHLKDFLLTLYEDLFHQLYAKEKEINAPRIRNALTIEPLLALVRPCLVAFIAFETLQRFISLGRFNLYTQAVGQLDSNLYSLMYTLSQLYENNLFMDRLFRFLALQPVVEATPQDQSVIPDSFPLPPSIEFCDVSFHYPDSQKPVLDHVSFRIEPGETVALVGENGAGKTTLVKLLAGLYQPTGGRILLNDIDISTIDKRVLRSYLGVIFQDYSIYHLSVYENIGLGSVEAMHDRTRIEVSAQQSGLSNAIEQLPQGYETILGRWIERGHELSGGQRQLVALARALMRRAAVLILDEPSAALDIHKERAFFQSLFEQHKDKQQTIVFISHRFSSVKHADHIILLEAGTVLEEGTHAELMKQQGRYAYLFSLQIRTYEESFPSRELESSSLSND